MSTERVHLLVTSDTHLTLGARLPTALLRLADRADHIVHAGDFITVDVLETLETLAPVTAVHGNVCDGEVARRLPLRAEVAIAGVQVGIVHDPGPAQGRHDRLRAGFPGCALIVYGHTHAPELTWLDGRELLVCNPGSPVQRRHAPFHSAAWLELAAGRIVAADLVDLDAASA
ncbi:MAG: metallophosphoesterase family protein [Thermoleophilia bacterium]|nr:metallophosphoesterase family protein [Thermoleophilia bacterium]